MKIAVLMGGTSAERDVSLSTGTAVSRALAEAGHDVTAIDCAYGDRLIDFKAPDSQAEVRVDPSDIEKERTILDRNLFRTIEYLTANRFEVVFPALHGGYGENGQLQALLELARLKFTGSGSTASAVGMNKHLSKVLFRDSKVAVADWTLLRRSDPRPQPADITGRLPLVVKPNEQGSTVGLTIVRRAEELPEALEKAFHYDEFVMLEAFIPGRELTVTILGDEPLPVIEIIPESGFYDYESKYQSGRTRYVVPAEIPAELTAEIQAAALRAYRSIGCGGYARVDFRLREDGAFFCLEVNTLPGMTPTSLVPKSALAAGIDFQQLMGRIITMAVAREVS